MDRPIAFDFKAKALLLVLGLCAFFSVFATIDTSEHYRAWRSALTWNERQREVAPAPDAERMHALILTCLAMNTAIVTLSTVGALALGIAVATDGKTAHSLATGSTRTVLGLGVLFAILMSLYRILVGERVLLKGPIFDYHLGLQIPILLAMVAYPSLALYHFIISRRGRGADKPRA